MKDYIPWILKAGDLKKQSVAQIRHGYVKIVRAALTRFKSDHLLKTIGEKLAMQDHQEKLDIQKGGVGAAQSTVILSKET